MKTTRNVHLSVFTITCACVCHAATGRADENQTANDILNQQKAEYNNTTNRFAATAALDYFHYEWDINPGGQSGLSGAFGSGKMTGDLGGSTLTLNYKHIYIDGSFRIGTASGPVNYGIVSSSDEVERREGELRATLRTGTGLFGLANFGGWCGASYTYISEDYTETLPSGYVWGGSGSAIRKYGDEYDNFLGEAGLQYTFRLIHNDAYTLRLIPKAGGGLGYGYYDQDSTRPDVDPSKWQAGFMWQGTAQLELSIHDRHTLFLEAGFKRFGFWQTTGNNISENYYGPYVRIGYSYAF